MSVQQGDRVILDRICISNVFPTISAGVNDRVYFAIITSSPQYFVATLGHGIYTTMFQVAAALKSALNNVSSGWTAVYDARLDRIVIGRFPGLPFVFLTDNALKLGISWHEIVEDPRSANDVLGLKGYSAQFPTLGALKFPAATNLRRYQYLFVRSDLATPMQAMDSMGQSDVVRRVVWSAAPLQLIVDSHETDADYINLNAGTLSSIHISLTDHYGRLIDLEGSEWSFILIFEGSEDMI